MLAERKSETLDVCYYLQVRKVSVKAGSLFTTRGAHSTGSFLALCFREVTSHLVMGGEESLFMA